MPTLKIKATKMSDAKVSFISLVERGANRIPFKIVKQENGMAGNSSYAGLDLANLFTQKADVASPGVEIIGVVTLKDEHYDAVKKQLLDNGIKTDDEMEQEDGSVVFKQVEGAVEGDGQIIRLNEHVAIITKGFSPYMMDVQVGDQSFQDQVTAQGFFPGISTVMDVMRQSVMKSVENAATPSDAAERITSLFDEARNYVSSLVTTLPTSVFKIEDIFPEFATKGEGEGDGEGGDEEEIVCKGCGKKKKVPDMAVKDDKTRDDVCLECKEGSVAKTDTVVTPDTSDANSLTEEKVTGIVTTALGQLMGDLTKKMEDSLAAIQSKVDSTLQAMDVKVTEAQTVAKSAEDRVAGIVITGGTPPDHDPAPAKKSERVGFGREIDTAFIPRSQRVRRLS